MTNSETDIFTALSGPMAATGFEPHASDPLFIRKRAYGHDAVYIVDEGDGFAGGKDGDSLLTVSCGVRHERIEMPWNTLGFITGDENKRLTNTLMWGFPRLEGESRFVLHLRRAEDDVSRIAQAIMRLHGEALSQFFAKFSDLAVVESLANCEPFASVAPFTLGGIFEHQAMRNLLLAKAVGAPHYPALRTRFVELDRGMFSRERRMQMLAKVDAYVFAGR